MVEKQANLEEAQARFEVARDEYVARLQGAVKEVTQQALNVGAFAHLGRRTGGNPSTGQVEELFTLTRELYIGSYWRRQHALVAVGRSGTLYVVGDTIRPYPDSPLPFTEEDWRDLGPSALKAIQHEKSIGESHRRPAIGG